MPGRRNPPAKWVLPGDVDPVERLCIQIEIPNERFHRAAFAGALQDLASAYKWADDDAHTAKRVANVWRKVISSMTICPDFSGKGEGITIEDLMSQSIRISPDDPCIIQMWCIDHWEDWYDPRKCIPGAVTQPPPGGTIPPAECQTWSVTLQGNSKWLLPVVVSEGDTIIIADAKGGWADGTINWYCPNGGFYTLGVCGSASAPVGTDPIPTISHMRMIAEIDGAFYDAYNATLSPLAGASDVQVTFQANDSTLSDNSGSIQFDVTVCKAAAVPLAITYASGLGIGPSTANVGDIINIGAVLYVPSGDYVAYPQFSRCVKLQIVGASGYSPDARSNATYWTWIPCGGSIQTCDALQPCDGSDPTVFPTGLSVSEYQLISATPMTVSVKILEIAP